MIFISLCFLLNKTNLHSLWVNLYSQIVNRESPFFCCFRHSPLGICPHPASSICWSSYPIDSKISGKDADTAHYQPQIVAFLETLWFQSYNFFRKCGHHRWSSSFAIANRHSSIPLSNCDSSFIIYYLLFCQSTIDRHRHRNQPSAISHQPSTLPSSFAIVCERMAC